MIEGLEDTYLKGALEALLFVTDEPVNVLTLATMLEAEAKDVEAALQDIQHSFENSDSGIQLRQTAGGWRLSTHPRYHELIERYVVSWDTRKLSAAALETLAIVAYTQPVTRAQISSIRGVSSDSSINSLLEKGLVREAGVADAPGNPTLYATTRVFLEKFGLNSVRDLTDISEFAPDEETKRLIAERLSSTREEVLISDEHAQALVDHQQAHQNGSIENGEPLNQHDEEISDVLKDVLASTLGVVDKINFDELEFDTSDE